MDAIVESARKLFVHYNISVFIDSELYNETFMGWLRSIFCMRAICVPFSLMSSQPKERPVHDFVCKIEEKTFPCGA
jgi:hypothetical protein